MKLEERVVNLAKQYLSDCNEAYNLLKEELGFDDPLVALRSGKISRFGRTRTIDEYQFHGVGCSILMATTEVDFDFDQGGRIRLFDHYRLNDYLECNRIKLNCDLNTGDIRSGIEQAELCGLIKCIKPSFGGAKYVLVENRDLVL